MSVARRDTSSAVEHRSPAELMSGHARVCSAVRVMLATVAELLKFNARSLDDVNQLIIASSQHEQATGCLKLRA
jgi:hypothetical protein